MISASEGKKFADVISKVTKDIKELGPFTDYQKMNSEFTAFISEQPLIKNELVNEKEIV